MKTFEERALVLKRHIEQDQIKIMIIGLGSVGTYLLDYLLSKGDPAVTVIVVGRNKERVCSNLNIVKISALIRGRNRSKVLAETEVDLNCVEQITGCIKKHGPDFIVNSSRVYSGLKYGSISWNNLRAYGIWSPLAVKYIKNIMEAYEAAGSDAIVINTSYSDAVIPWLKQSGRAYPDFGSGNLNHLIPRMKYAAGELMQVEDYWNIEVMLATSHFHDVVISKEGQTEGMEQLLKVYYEGKEMQISNQEIIAGCKIEMPSDEKRNMMNASSNYEIINEIIEAIRKESKGYFYSPGAFGEIGGYPVVFDACKKSPSAHINDSVFTLDEMRKANKRSISFDGIEAIVGEVLYYTDELVDKVKKAFSAKLPKAVTIDDSQQTADFIIEHIINPELNRKKEINL